MTKPETQESPDTEKTQPPSGGLPPLALQFMVGIVAAVVVVAIAAGINHAWPIFGTSDGGDKIVLGGSPTAAPTADAPVVVQMDVADAPTKGPKDAKVTIVEFSDFQCPYCARFVTQTMPQILSTYGDKVLFAFRNYPLPPEMHPYAQKAAEASECANDQGAFWQYHDLLFEKQNDLTAIVEADATNGVAQVITKMEEYAASLSLDTAKFNECLESGADAEKVSSDATALTDGLEKAGVSRFGTPSFFINGTFISGAYPFDENSPGYQPGMITFKATIDEALAKAE
ncbi:MAG TPA: thioredoxin domain-containing protein [Dehalococcoidia bacterium]|nr:thioredoxin domain-containing protein [Dehalococcoidia bacterium]